MKRVYLLTHYFVCSIHDEGVYVRRFMRWFSFHASGLGVSRMVCYCTMTILARNSASGCQNESDGTEQRTEPVTLRQTDQPHNPSTIYIASKLNTPLLLSPLHLPKNASWATFRPQDQEVFRIRYALCLVCGVYVCMCVCMCVCVFVCVPLNISLPLYAVHT